MSSGTQHKVAGTGAVKFDCPEKVRQELDRVLKSDAFSATPKRRAMLTYLIEEALAGRADTLKGYAIGLAVFGRDESFDPQSDPIVRLEARRLRHDLDSYYISEGAGNPMRISIPKGQYAPRFHSQVAEVSLTANVDNQMEVDTESRANNEDEIRSERTVRWPLRLRRLALSLGVLAFLMIAAVLLFQVWTGRIEAPVKGDPSVMILPFELLSQDRTEALLAAGVADQLTTSLSRFSGFRLFLPPAAGSKEPPIDPIVIGRRKGISYLVTGTVGVEGSLVRVSARLIETASGRILWVGSYDRSRNRSSLMSIEQGISAEIASVIGQPYGIIKSELANSLPAAAETSTDSFECVLRGYVYRRSFSRPLHEELRACLQGAVERDPEYAEAWAMLGWIYLDEGRFGFAEDGDKELAYDRALDAASHALTLDGSNVLALKAKSSINHYMGNIEEGERFARRALEVNPNDPDSMAQLGWRLAVVGKFDEGIPYLEKAIDRTVNAPGWYYHLVAIDHLLKGRPSEMLTAAKQGVLSNSGFSWCLVAIAQSELGHMEAAHAALNKMAETAPGMYRDPTAFLKTHQADEQIEKAIMSGLKKAGWSAPVGN